MATTEDNVIKVEKSKISYSQTANIEGLDRKRNRESTSQKCLMLFKTRYQETVEAVEAVDFTWRTCSEVGGDCLISLKGNVYSFLEFTRCVLHRLPEVGGQNDHNALLSRIIGRFVLFQKTYFLNKLKKLAHR